jgi:hypothetical protein
MKQLKTVFILCALFCFCNLTSAQTEPTSADMQAMMKNSTPGDVHAKLAKSVGNWRGDMTMWMDPSSQPVKQEATVKNEMTMGGRYLTSKWTGTMMGMPFEGVSILAYDNGTKKFYNTWMDNMSTGMTMMTGDWKEANKSVEFRGTSSDPMTGKEMKMREVWTIIDDTHQKMEMYMEHDGREMKGMEIMLTKM